MESTPEANQHPYWHGWSLVISALDANHQAAASAAFHRAVSLMPAAIDAAEANYEAIPEDIRSSRAMMAAPGEDPRQNLFYPLTDRDSIAFAAVREDRGSLKILDSICGSFGAEEPAPCSKDYLRIVKTVQEMVAANEVTDINDVRKVFSPTDRVRLRSVWRAMRDAKMLTVESRGQKIFFHRDAPKASPAPAKPAVFRIGQPAAETTLIILPAHLKPQPKALSDSDAEDNPEATFESWPVAKPAESNPVPKDSRRTRKADVLSVGNKSWLRSGLGKRADGSRYIPTFVINQDGSAGPAVDLDEVYWLRSNPQGDCAVSVDRDANVRIYTPEAEQVFSANLAAAPEVRDTMRKFGDKQLKPSSAIRSVHGSLATERLAITVIDAVFVYSFNGDVIAAFEVEEHVQEYLFSGRIVASSPKRDWAYFVQLTADGQGLFIGTYSGVLLHLSFSGELIESWSLPAAPNLLHETADGIVGLAATAFFRAGRGGPVQYEHHGLRALPQVLGSHVILDDWKSTGVFDLDEFKGKMVELPKPRTAAYLANRRLVMETATTKFFF